MSKRKVLIGCGSVAAAFIGLIVFAVSYYFYDTYRENRADLEIRQLPKTNPTAYVFEGELKSVRQQIFEEFSSVGKHRDSFPFKNPDTGNAANFNEFTKEEGHAFSLEKDEVFKNPADKNDIFLENDGVGIRSKTYFALGRPLDYLIHFQIHLESGPEGKTKVTIIPLDTNVYKGYKGRGMHGGLLPMKVPVEPTTVEEYELLRHIGLILGENNMPDVTLPTPKV